MIRSLLSVGVAALPLAALTVPAEANEFEPQLRALYQDELQAWLDEPVLIEGIKRANERHADLGEARIEELDQQWRSEVDSGGGELTEKAMSTELSAWLRERQEASDGLITEVFAVDNKGLNAGQSALTSDYMQGDEAKWQQTYLEGPNAVFIDEVEFDESTGTFQAQLSATVTDPDTDEAIGSITFGVDLDRLLSS